MSQAKLQANVYGRNVVVDYEKHFSGGGPESESESIKTSFGGVDLNIIKSLDAFGVSFQAVITSTQETADVVRINNHFGDNVTFVTNPQGDSTCTIPIQSGGEINKKNEKFVPGSFQNYDLRDFKEAAHTFLTTNFSQDELSKSLETAPKSGTYWLAVASSHHLKDGNFQALVKTIRDNQPESGLATAMNIDELALLTGSGDLLSDELVDTRKIDAALTKAGLAVGIMLVTHGEKGGMSLKYNGKWYQHHGLPIEPTIKPINWSGSGDLSLAIVAAAVIKYEEQESSAHIDPINPAEYFKDAFELAMRATHFNSQDPAAVSLSMKTFFKQYQFWDAQLVNRDQ